MNIKILVSYILGLYTYLGIFSSSALVHSTPLLMSTIKSSMSVLIGAIAIYSSISFKTYKELIIILVILFYCLFKQDMMTINIATIIMVSMYIYRYNSKLDDYIVYLKPLYIVTVFGVISVFFLEVLGFSQKQIFYIYTSDIHKSAHGFYNPNALGIYSLAICSYILLISKKKILDYLILTITLYFLYSAGARTTIYALYLMIILYIICKINITEKLLRCLIFPLSSLFILIGYVIFILALIFDKDTLFLSKTFFNNIDYWTSFRLTLIKYKIQNFEVIDFLFGANTPSPIEMGWYHLTISFGGLLVMIILSLSVIYSFKKNPKITFYIGTVLVFLISNIFENFFITYNLFAYIAFYQFHKIISSFKWRES